MEKLADVVMPFVERLHNPDERLSLEQILAMWHGLDAQMVSAESANKGLPAIRRMAVEGVPSVITKHGNASTGDESIVISVRQLVELMADICRHSEQDAATRKPADAVLASMRPISGEAQLLLPRLRAHEEIVGGRPALR